MKIDKKHLLSGTETINYITAAKNKREFEIDRPDTIIIHYTAGRNAESSAKYLAKDGLKASAHIVIGRKGEIYQLVPFNIISWHAGVSQYGARKGYNKYAIGIEMDNAGILTKTGNQYISWFGKKYPAEEVVEATHRNESTARYWHSYTENQIEICEQVCELLIDRYNIKVILGHEEISPGRKQDPGPAFPLDKFRNRLLYNDRESEDHTSLAEAGEVIPDKLNIRTGPGTGYDIAAPPLSNGAKVRILKQDNEWYKVATEVTGWVAKKYIKA